MSKCSNITQYPQVILLSRKQKKSARDKRLPDEERLESLVRDRLYDVDYLLVPRDKPKAHAALGWRVIVIVIAWVVLAWRVEPGTGYFVSLFLFATPLIVDYTSFEPDDRLRKWCHNVAIGAAIVWAFIGFMGGVGLFAIEKAADGFLIYTSPDFIYSLRPIPLVHFHSLVLISVALALIDFVAYRSPLELALSDYAVEQAAARKGD